MKSTQLLASAEMNRNEMNMRWDKTWPLSIEVMLKTSFLPGPSENSLNFYTLAVTCLSNLLLQAATALVLLYKDFWCYSIYRCISMSVVHCFPCGTSGVVPVKSKAWPMPFKVLERLDSTHGHQVPLQRFFSPCQGSSCKFCWPRIKNKDDCWKVQNIYYQHWLHQITNDPYIYISNTTSLEHHTPHDRAQRTPPAQHGPGIEP